MHRALKIIEAVAWYVALSLMALTVLSGFSHADSDLQNQLSLAPWQKTAPITVAAALRREDDPGDEGALFGGRDVGGGMRSEPYIKSPTDDDDSDRCRVHTDRSTNRGSRRLRASVLGSGLLRCSRPSDHQRA